MSDIKDKEYSALKEDLEMLGNGAEKHKADKEHPLPSNITLKRYDDMEKKLEEFFLKAKDAEKIKNEAFDEYHKVFDEAEGMKNTDSRAIKGIFGIYNQELRDFGIAPEKKRTGRKPKNGK